MPIYSTWIVEGHLAYWKSWGELSGDDIPAFEEESRGLIASTTAVFLHTIADHSQLAKLPSLRETAQIASGRDPKLGWYLVIGEHNPLVKLMISLTVQVLGVRLRFFPNYDEALAFIQGQDATLPAIETTEAELLERIRSRHAVASTEPAPF